MLAVGLLPLWVGSPNMGGFALLNAPYLYLVSLVVCWGFADPGRWWRRLATLDVTIAFIVGLFLLGGFELGFISDFGLLGWRGDVVLIACGAFIIGLTGKGLKATVVVAMAMTAFGMTMRYLLPNNWILEDLGGGLQFASGYFYDSLPKLLLVLMLLGFGRMVGEALRGSVRGPVLRHGDTTLCLLCSGWRPFTCSYFRCDCRKVQFGSSA